MVKNVDGAIVECGIGRGRSLVVLSALNTLLGDGHGGGREIFGFDSFQGFPEPRPEDASYREPKKGEWSSSPSGMYEYSPDFILEVLACANLEGKVKRDALHKGFFCETLPTFDCGTIAILHLDGDLYDSYRDPLLNLYDRVAVGGVIVFDDFATVPDGPDRFPGGRQATIEFFADKPEDLRNTNRGTPYVIKE
ncbi:MAG: TylF/MycF/NovP-related O-methyltransferase [Rhodospirillales bacterium]